MTPGRRYVEALDTHPSPSSSQLNSQCGIDSRDRLEYSVQVKTKSALPLLSVIRQGGSVPKIIITLATVGSMSSRQAKLQEDTYFRVMGILEETPDLTQRELAQRLGISLGALNYCLKALIGKGLVKMKNFSKSKNKFGYAYVLTPTGIAERAVVMRRFLHRKMEEFEALKSEIELLKMQLERSIKESR